MLSRLYMWILFVGDRIGKILAFLTLPATLVAGYVYFDEVRDYFSTPELDTKIKRVTLRCNYVWRDSAAYRAYQMGMVDELTSLCNRSPIAVSFEFQVSNNDAIAREIRSLKVGATLPVYGVMELNEVQSVEHLIQHGVETNLRRDWRVETIPAGTSEIFEILAFSDTTTDDSDHWVRLASAMDDNSDEVLDAAVNISLAVKTNGFFNRDNRLATCDFNIDQSEIDQWMEKTKDRRIQITNTCQ